MNTMLIKSIYGKGITAFKPSKQVKSSNRSRHQVSAKVGLFYSTSTGNTQAAAEWIQEKFAKHGDIAAPVDICEAKVSDMQAFDSLIVGAPTWNTGADEGRSGTVWDDVLDELGALNLKGKKVAIFGCGDSVAYGEYFCDAIEEIYMALEPSGADFIGKTDPAGYDFSDSKSLVDGKFLGLPLDDDNEVDKTETRVENWCTQLVSEGME
jgi:flavodoxin I